ncbi:MAG: hypothetical protein NC124_18325 [Clostridium sp.]|nr:hypothetical protein [Clostridium sp.]
MRYIIKSVRKLLVVYESGYEYWVKTRDIKVNPEWIKILIEKVKFPQENRYWHHTGEFKSKILLDKDFNLIDGYNSVRIARINDIDKVPVYFVN